MQVANKLTILLRNAGLAVLIGCIPYIVSAQNGDTNTEDSLLQAINMRKFNTSLQNTNNPSLSDTNGIKTPLPLKGVSQTPMISLQQYIKGNASGIFIREGDGEAGAEQMMFIRGLTTPLFTREDLYSAQPVVYLNGVPLTQENAFTYNIQRYDFNKLGSATNLLSILDINNIGSIEVLKTPADLAKLGPLASNGAIWVTTKTARSLPKPLINAESYVGVLQPPKVETINADYENNFRWPFYEKFATEAQKADYPVYVRNSFDPNYYGPANWNDIYYKAKPIYYLGVGLLGGTERANFRFNISGTKDRNFDATAFNRYAIAFGINMIPLKWLTISSNINAARINRDRNHNLRDRFAEARFVPDLSNPLSPNKESYNNFLKKYQGSIDKNVNNSFIGGFSATAKFGDLELKSSLSIDYEESHRNVFWGKPLMDDNSFLSTYFGFNQRGAINNSVKYTIPVANNTQSVQLEAGQHYVKDFYKYDYVIAYNSPNDFIKVKEIYLSSTGYANRNDMFGYPFSDNLKAGLSSFYGRLGYSYKNIAILNGVIKYDGYSSFSPTDRWLLTPAVSARINMHEIADREVFNTFAIRASWGIFGKLIQDNRFRIGPQYRVDMGYSDEPVLGSYGGDPGLSQPYSFGWIAKYYNWPFSEKFNVGTDIGFLKNRIMLGLDLYQNTDKNMIVPTPIAAENGFNYKYVQGMSVRNEGVNFDVVAQLLNDPERLTWLLNTNFSWNRNRLVKLPYELSSVQYGSKKIEIGKPVDSYWVYENIGSVINASDVPVVGTNPDGSQRLLTFGGTSAFNPGDPLWRDIDGDGIINDRDKVLKGHSLPVYTGGLGSTLGYKGFDLDFQFFYALGHQLLNRSVSNKLDFINGENSKDITSIKEITFWQKTFNPADYPMYNPWSGVIPYRADQDLFLQNADYLKLRYVSLGYNLTSLPYFRKSGISKALLYVTGNNLLTISPFKGGDPEQVDFYGMYNGRYLPLASSFSVGLKLNF